MSNLLTGLKSDVRLDSEEAHYARLVEQYRELEAKVPRWIPVSEKLPDNAAPGRNVR